MVIINEANQRLVDIVNTVETDSLKEENILSLVQFLIEEKDKKASVVC